MARRCEDASKTLIATLWTLIMCHAQQSALENGAMEKETNTKPRQLKQSRIE